MESVASVILAAGKGKRMKSDLPKVLHKVMGQTIIQHVSNAVPLKKGKGICVVSSDNQKLIAKDLGADYEMAVQKEQKGTGDAVKSALKYLKDSKITNVLVLPGDMPLLQKNTISKLIKKHLKSKAEITILTGLAHNPYGYGRIVRDKAGKISAIIEEKDLNLKQKDISEVNTGVYVFKKEILISSLKKLKADNSQKEYYLTDVIKIAYNSNHSNHIEGLKIDFSEECLGINSRQQLAQAIKKMRLRKLDQLMNQGVTIEDLESTFIDSCVKIGKDTIIKPFSVISGDVKIGKRCEIGPFAHIREGVILADQACIGNFVEAKKSIIGKGSKAKHLTYLGNTTLGDKVNVGAGTITANYDGVNKHPTVVGSGTKLGSNTVIIAPNKIGKNVVVGAGTVIPANRKIPANSLVFGVPARISKTNLT